ncbi:DNA (cytosine-5-)-methyltransferase [Aerococcus urinaeequi]|uniref:Cytosine-specific methyltransferase n=1 Tax=Aerococcus urinaeequi TaxID=51665 RepID=A0AAC8X0D4_9LACT|nr:DNA (cytosine-5-)-methyltransferase [Aerococcus urinaeequi]AMB97389.1 modification methylase [Aerococcus urinaeequi]
MLKVIESFAGIGSQSQALENLGIDFDIVATLEWEIGAIFAYDILHNGPQDLSPYRFHNRESLIEKLREYSLSNDGKEPITDRALSSMSVQHLKAVLCAIERNNNLVDITKVHGEQLPDADVLTYSFPCQDLSISGHWHHNSGGIDRDANNRSTLLWEVERLLKEYVEVEKDLPSFLLMENVSNILSSKHIGNFREWQNFLEGLGYVNQVYTLDARNFNVPQSRVRTYMISVLAHDSMNAKAITQYFEDNNLEEVKVDFSSLRPMSDYLRLDYSNPVYRNEAIQSTPIFTPSRQKIYEQNPILAIGSRAKSGIWARTVTTKQDRNPNSGIVAYGDEKLTDVNHNYRNLTARECFLLMGFDEDKYDRMMESNFKVRSNRNMLNQAKLIQLAGNSIVVQVLEQIFAQISEIKDKYLTESSKVTFVTTHEIQVSAT